jgi:hypothetical protein
MRKTQKEHDKIYILESRRNIDNFINKNEFIQAFGLLIHVLERLDDGSQKNEFIDYYSKKMAQFGIFENIFSSR